MGKTVEAALYALLTDSFFLNTRIEPPLFFKKLEVPLLGFDTEPGAWSRLSLMLGLLGKLCQPDENTTPRITYDEIKFQSSGRLQRYKFKECSVFDPTGITLENKIKETSATTYTVVDDFELSSLGKKYPYLNPYESKDKFAQEIHFYTSPRVDGASFVTDCAMISTLTQEQLNSFEYSDSIAKFVVLRHLTALGVYGIFMNNYKNGSPKYRKPKVKHVKRVVIPKDNSTYQDSEHVNFKKLSIQEVLNECSPKR